MPTCLPGAGRLPAVPTGLSPPRLRESPPPDVPALHLATDDVPALRIARQPTRLPPIEPCPRPASPGANPTNRSHPDQPAIPPTCCRLPIPYPPERLAVPGPVAQPSLRPVRQAFSQRPLSARRVNAMASPSGTSTDVSIHLAHAQPIRQPTPRQAPTSPPCPPRPTCRSNTSPPARPHRLCSTTPSDKPRRDITPASQPTRRATPARPWPSPATRPDRPSRDRAPPTIHFEPNRLDKPRPSPPISRHPVPLADYPAPPPAHPLDISTRSRWTSPRVPSFPTRLPRPRRPHRPARPNRHDSPSLTGTVQSTPSAKPFPPADPAIR